MATVALALALSTATVLSPAPAYADTFTVNQTADSHDALSADELCDSDLGAPGRQCTLRAAVEQANSLAGEHTIELPAGTYEYDLEGPDVTAALTVRGAGAARTTITHAPSSAGVRLFTVNGNGPDPDGALDLRDVTLTGANNDCCLEFGGAIVNEGTLIVRRSVIAGNRITNGVGGAIYSGVGLSPGTDPSLIVLDSTIGDPAGGEAANRAKDGAGIYNDGGDLTIRRSEVVGNLTFSAFVYSFPDPPSASDLNRVGGGLRSLAGSDDRTLIADSTIAGNSSHRGSALFLTGPGTHRVERTTISGNTARAGTVISFSPLELVNSTVSGNVAEDMDGATGNLSGVGFDGGSGSTIFHVTFADNTPGPGFAADVRTSVAGVTAKSSIFASPSNLSCEGGSPLESNGFNIERPGNSCGLDRRSDRPATDPLLLPLADNGGPTLTHALRPRSPAVGAADRGDHPAADQRGAPRGFDVGAYELVRCAGVIVNHVGTPGRDRIVGTAGRDGIVGLAGADVIRSKGGRDGVCAGAGKDTVAGGGGKKDKLLGQAGRDVLRGGSGRRDLCHGGPGRDRADRSCERTRAIP
ncbi:MAG TPA: choice-of-anchor Q domain-containing protein [Solirubrobacterales bacterium]|nr:choice-of-anchor Q domain-containing protein [Solirubrobacterales bacterium]